MELTTVRECAQRWGLSAAAARRVLAPVDAIDRDPDTGAMRYDRAAAEAARQCMPGKGHRTDLPQLEVSPEEYRRLIADESIPAAHRALWALMWESELRLAEALSLDVRDIDPEGKTATAEDIRGRGSARSRSPARRTIWSAPPWLDATQVHSC
ncbi:site-specific integrase [Streptomyces sp. NA04227]|uniref:site-specific integrase n=1 Tax=Streptomyces sp. NA04227 TaxID=2742136 RepID=UPI00158FAE85|nr:site-specific integrase [Streptomyces sp. NA04227]QKW06949.1 site-specific integrase [Streptomyces sp. NA04227]